MQGKLFSFFLNDMLIGIDIRCVKEVNRSLDFNPVPGSSEQILGLMNLRGSIIPVFNLKKILNVPEAAEPGCFCMVMRPIAGEDEQIAFLIDKPGEVVDVEEAACEAMPAHYYGIEDFPGTEVCKLESEIIPIIDTEALFRHMEGDME